MAPRDANGEDRGPAYAPVTNDELHGHYYEDLAVGLSAVASNTITQAAVAAFAAVSGDTNPVHLSEQFGAATMFEGRIAHGMLSASFISAVIGTKLPGPGAIYMGQTLKFMAPVRVGDTVNTRVTVTALDDEKNRATLETVCMIGDEIVIEGEALVKVPLRNPPEE